MIRNIIFDWSGTLVDDLPAVWRATNAVFRKAGVEELTLDRFRAEFRLPFHGFYLRYVPHVSPAQLEEWFHTHFREAQDLVGELPHAREFLLFVRERGIRTFLLSALHQEYFVTQAGSTGFGDYIDVPYLQVWDKRTKIREIMETEGLDPAETLFIGDMQHDVETAHHGGVFSCAVLTGYNRLDQLRASEPHLIVEHLGELRSILEKSNFDVSRSRNGEGSKAGRVPVATVGALIRDDEGRALMIRTQKWSGLWGIPGGKIHWGESSVDALKRELKEETGLDVEDIRLVMAQDCIASEEFYRKEHFILLNYTCRCIGEPCVTLNEEAQEYRWVTISEALELPLNRPTRKLIESVRRGEGLGTGRNGGAPLDAG